MKHIAIYMRVSSKAQDVKSQQPDLEKWAVGQGEAASGSFPCSPNWRSIYRTFGTRSPRERRLNTSCPLPHVQCEPPHSTPPLHRACEGRAVAEAISKSQGHPADRVVGILPRSRRLLLARQ